MVLSTVDSIHSIHTLIYMVLSTVDSMHTLFNMVLSTLDSIHTLIQVQVHVYFHHKKQQKTYIKYKLEDGGDAT